MIKSVYAVVASAAVYASRRPPNLASVAVLDLDCLAAHLNILDIIRNCKKKRNTAYASVTACPHRDDARETGFTLTVLRTTEFFIKSKLLSSTSRGSLRGRIPGSENAVKNIRAIAACMHWSQSHGTPMGYIQRSHTNSMRTIRKKRREDCRLMTNIIKRNKPKLRSLSLQRVRWRCHTA